MSLRKVLPLAVVFILLATVGIAQKRTVKGSVEGSGTDFVGQCQGFSVQTDYNFRFIFILYYDKNGELVKERAQFKVIGESVYYNSTNLNKAVSGGPGEVANQTFDTATGQVRIRGMLYKVRIPGYGLVFAESGEEIWQCDDPYTFTNCVMVKDTGHNQLNEQDIAALCDYLK
jgi:hypothetical protein